MKYTILILIAFLAISCSKTRVNPIPKYTSLIGSWRMETNNGIDVSFDIISNPNTLILYSANTKVTYQGITSSPVAYDYQIDVSNGYTIQLYSTVNTSVETTNATFFDNLRSNSTFTQLSGDSGRAYVGGYVSQTNLPINFTPPITINRIK